MEGSPSFSRALRPETVHPMKIVINGREYDGIDQMPPDVRQQYLQLVGSLGDADRNGVPDVLERPGSSSVEVNTSIICNGREYKDRSELPAEVREILERMPPPQPGGTQTRVEVQTKVLSSKEDISARWQSEGESKTPGFKRSFPWALITILLVMIVILLFLWLSGVTPPRSWRR